MSTLAERITDFLRRKQVKVRPVAEGKLTKIEVVDPHLVTPDAQYELAQRSIDGQVEFSAVDRLESVVGQVTEKCPNCGGKYQGPVGNSCDYCGRESRPVYLVRVAEEKNPATLSVVSAPAAGISAPGGFERTSDGYVIGVDAVVDRLVAVSIQAAAGLRCEYLAGKRLSIGPSADLGRVLVYDGGQAAFGDNTRVGDLVAGTESRLIFGDDCFVDSLRTRYVASMRTGRNFEVQTQKEIGYTEYLELFG